MQENLNAPPFGLLAPIWAVFAFPDGAPEWCPPTAVGAIVLQSPAGVTLFCPLDMNDCQGLLTSIYEARRVGEALGKHNGGAPVI